jgi:zinc transport system substrate-binding protein
MSLKRFLLPILLFSLLIILGACGAESYQAPPAAADVNIAVSILPQQYFVKKIGGNHVSVLVLAGPGVNPLTYTPPKAQLKALNDRDIYFLMGIPPETTWLVDIAKRAPNIKLLDISQGIPKTSDDPHIWLSPRLVKIQAQTIAQALIDVDPTHEVDYQANLDAFLTELDDLDRDIQRIMDENQVAGKTFIVAHPAWGYFVRDYGLEMVTIPENATDEQLQELARLAQEKRITTIFYQRGFDEVSPEKLARLIDGRTMPLEPLNPSWEPNLRSVAMMLAKSVH